MLNGWRVAVFGRIMAGVTGAVPARVELEGGEARIDVLPDARDGVLPSVANAVPEPGDSVPAGVAIRSVRRQEPQPRADALRASSSHLFLGNAGNPKTVGCVLSAALLAPAPIFLIRLMRCTGH